MHSSPTTSPPPQSRVCVECGNIFEWIPTKSRPPLVCSPTCKKQRRSAQFRKSDDRKLAKVDRELQCPQCGQNFERPPGPGRWTYCGSECAAAAHRLGDARRSLTWRRGVEQSGRTCTVEGCNKAPTASKGLCGLHYSRLRLRGDVGSVEREREPGVLNWFMRVDGYIARGTGHELQHRVVMEELLDRPLEAWENVHHRNGRRADNRPENLELWVKPQPAGQRASDLADWVVEHYPDLVVAAMARRDLL